MRIFSKGRLGSTLAAGAATLLLALAGCGGSDDESTTEVAQDKAEFIAAADAICARTSAEVGAEVRRRFPKGSASPSRKDLIAVFEEATIPAIEKQFDEIAALSPPAGEEQQIQAILDEAERALTESKQDPELLLVITGDPTPFDEVNGLQQDFGFEVCGASDPAR